MISSERPGGKGLWLKEMAVRLMAPLRKTASEMKWMVSENPRQRRSGRPNAQASEELDRRVLDMAVGMFVEHGYAATSIEKLAALARVGKQTIYRRYPTKEDLFSAAMSALRDRFLHAALLPVHCLADPLAAIREACLAVMEVASTPETVGMYRVLIAEAQRFPQLVDQVMLHTADPLHHNVQARLQAAMDAGQLKCAIDPEVLARVLVGMVSGWVLNQWLVGREPLKTREERLAFLDTAWTVFLDGVGATASVNPP